jgi:16S rRNA (guanine527-N7)-methyltransferase
VLTRLAEEPASVTTVRDPMEGVERHVEDSLTALRVPQVRDARVICDIGSGSGFPGLALAAALPTASVQLVESVERKCSFLSRTVSAASIPNAEIVCCRAEDWAGGQGKADVVTARALAPLAVLAEYAAPLLRDGGLLVAWKSIPSDAEVDAGDQAAAIVGLSNAGVVDLGPGDGAGRTGRRLYLYRKVAPTPERFPRRTGVASKRPLAP